MLVFLVMLLMAVIAVLAVRYMRINARALSKDTFASAAKKRAAYLRYEDPVINCDYCGAAIDTAKDRVCPRCGASYALDEEWRERHDPDIGQSDAEAAAYADERVREAKRQAQKTALLLKRCIILLAGIMALIVALAFAVEAISERESFKKDDVLNEYSYEHYEEADYAIEGDGVILDACGVKVNVCGFYADSEDGSVKIGYRIENNSGKNVRVSFELVGVNGSTDGGRFFLERIRKGDAVTAYEELYSVRRSKVADLVYRNVSLKDDEADTLFSSDSFLRFRTNADFTPEPRIPKRTLLYENNGVRVIGLGRDGESYGLCIVNGSGSDFTVTSSDFRADGRFFNSGGLYEEAVPAGYVFTDESLRCYEELPAGAVPEISVSFVCREDPAKNFSTGYLPLE